ncbi:hypothetical protein C8R43DRAFT_216388 [Mycena crocata]|nr:hypothetical protein C8R43DRAFT_216388 [Mycena crocata]
MPSLDERPPLRVFLLVGFLNEEQALCLGAHGTQNGKCQAKGLVVRKNGYFSIESAVDWHSPCGPWDANRARADDLTDRPIPALCKFLGESIESNSHELVE